MIKSSLNSMLHMQNRTVGRSENQGVPVLFDGHNLPTPMIEIGLTVDIDVHGLTGLPKSYSFYIGTYQE